MVNVGEWHNTGSNGPARETWVRRVGNTQACVEVMAYRVLVTMYVGNDVDEDHEGIPFKTLPEAKAWADAFIARRSVACVSACDYHMFGGDQSHPCSSAMADRQRRAIAAGVSCGDETPGRLGAMYYCSQACNDAGEHV
jgi:hypothetical protein